VRILLQLLKKIVTAQPSLTKIPAKAGIERREDAQASKTCYGSRINALHFPSMTVRDEQLQKISPFLQCYDFISLMISHHQGAIDRVDTYLSVGDDPRLINLAYRITTENN